MVEKITSIKVEGHPDLDTIIAHYDALPILINFIKRRGGNVILDAWNIQKNRKSHFIIKDGSIVLDSKQN